MATKDKEKDAELEGGEDDVFPKDELEKASEELDREASDDGEEPDEEAEEAEASEDEEAIAEADREEKTDAEPEPEGTQPAHLGATKYVHAAFFSAGILAAYLSGKILYTIWNYLADWPTASRAVPFLLRYAEDDRETFTLIAGAIIGVIAVIQTYRKAHVRRWADEVATELSKVTWPNKETVTNGTIVVVVASAIATVYVALLDRLWAFLTNLVYGA